MTNPGNIGNIASSSDPAALAKILADHQRQINELRTARSGNAMEIDGQPGITMRGGSLWVYDDAGHLICQLGKLTDGGGGSGMILYRTGGSGALRFRGGFIGLNDSQNNHIVSDDINSGTGIATPYLPLTTPVNTNVGTWPQTQNTSWTSIAECYMQRQNPGAYWAIQTAADTGTTGQVRIKFDGTVIATSPTVTGSFANWTGSYYWPAGWSFNSTTMFTLEAERLTGTGNVYAAVYQLTGVATP